MRADQFYTSDLNNRWAAAGALTFVLILANVTGFAIADGAGRKDYHHPAPLPAGVEQIDRETYLVPPNVTVAICRGSSNGADPIAKYRDLDRVDLKYVQCSHEQYWDDHRPESPSFTEAAVAVSTNPLVIAANALLLALFFQVPVRYRLAWARSRRRARVAQAGRYKQLHGELAGSWAAGHVSDEDFERKLEELEQNRAAGRL